MRGVFFFFWPLVLNPSDIRFLCPLSLCVKLLAMQMIESRRLSLSVLPHQHSECILRGGGGGGGWWDLLSGLS